MPAKQPVVIVGGGHNGLVAAAYLAAAGRPVTVLEARDEVGGAAVSASLFPGVEARLSRYSYLVSLLPQVVVDDLGLKLELRSRSIASYTPAGSGGVLIERPERERTRASFATLAGGDRDYQAWHQLEDDLQAFAAVVAPTLTRPLPRASELRSQLPESLWRALVEQPIGELIEARLENDLLRGVVLTDALIGTFASAHDAGRQQNRCFAYHVIGNGTGEWKVPVGGMGRVTAELARVARSAGATIETGVRVTGIRPRTEGGGVLTLADGRQVSADQVLVNCAPAVLDRLLGRPSTSPSGSQLKINMVLRRLPRLKSGLDPEVAFAGTLHLGQGYGRLQEAYETALAGQIPDPLPSEVYCHTLTDPSILSDDLQAAGYHTLTLFGLHTPAELFRSDPDGRRAVAREAALRALQSVLAEPLKDCLAVDGLGQPCIEVMTPLDVEAELGMPGGHIFHGDLSWPWLDDSAVADTAAERWGVATSHPGILLCGSGAVRGGAVSGLGGHNAAMAILEAG